MCILDEKAGSSERFKEKISGVAEVLKNQNVSGQTTSKIMEFYMHLYPSKQIHNDQDILADMPFAFSSEVQQFLLNDFVNSSAFFYGMHETVYVKVCTSLQLVYKTIHMTITSAGEVSDALYFVCTGRVSILMHGEEMKQARITLIFEFRFDRKWQVGTKTDVSEIFCRLELAMWSAKMPSWV